MTDHIMVTVYNKKPGVRTSHREDLSDLSRVRLLVSNTPLRSEEGRHCPALLHGAARRECERRGSKAESAL